MKRFMEETLNNHTAILTQLSNMNASLAVNTNETKNIRDGVSEIKEAVKGIDQKVGIQNGRVRTLEDWSKSAQVVIENNAKVTENYKTDKARLWAAWALLLLLGGTIIALSVAAIKSNIKEGIKEELAAYDIKIND